ncbi:hypothetical protein K456DRAFT_383213 [Colletotrichum gloeosporioides 23]|nr:hypothetical protein K456DRAFT_383213 [Colletotrichum gloeosporioides 23]
MSFVVVLLSAYSSRPFSRAHHAIPPETDLPHHLGDLQQPRREIPRQARCHSLTSGGNSCRDAARLHQLPISKSQAPVHANAKLPIPRFTRSTNQLRGNCLINHGCRGLFMIQHLPLLTADAAQKREMKTSTIQAAPIRRSRLNSTHPLRPTNRAKSSTPISHPRSQPPSSTPKTSQAKKRETP